MPLIWIIGGKWNTRETHTHTQVAHADVEAGLTQAAAAEPQAPSSCRAAPA